MGNIIILAALRCDMHWEFRCGCGFHVWRHSTASRFLAEGIPETAVANNLGYPTPQTTLLVYSHAFEEDLIKGIQSLKPLPFQIVALISK